MLERGLVLCSALAATERQTGDAAALLWHSKVKHKAKAVLQLLTEKALPGLSNPGALLADLAIRQERFPPKRVEPQKIMICLHCENGTDKYG